MTPGKGVPKEAKDMAIFRRWAQSLGWRRISPAEVARLCDGDRFGGDARSRVTLRDLLETRPS